MLNIAELLTKYKAEELIDMNEVARILTERAAKMGKYRVYDNKAVVKAVEKGAIAPVGEVGQMHLFLRSDAQTMKLSPLRGRTPPTVYELQTRLDELLERVEQGEHIQQGKITRARKFLAQAQEAERLSLEAKERRKAELQEEVQRTLAKEAEGRLLALNEAVAEEDWDSEEFQKLKAEAQ